MFRRPILNLIGLAVVMSASPVLSQTPPTETAPVATPAPGDQVVLETRQGPIVIALDPAAPITAANFLRYVEEKRFDGVDFYRAMKITPTLGLIQGGTQNAPDRILPPIAHEPTSETGLSHVDGAVSMARFDTGTATGDFFIIVGDVTSLDAGRGAPGDPGFAVFGRVVQGMDVVRAIMTAPTSATEGEGSMRGQMLEPRIHIISARKVVAAPN